MNVRFVLVLIGTLSVLTCPSAWAVSQEGALKISEPSESRIAGYSPSTKISFTSVLQSDGSIAVQLGIQRKTLNIDYNQAGLFVRLSLYDGSRPGGQLTEKDQKRLVSLYRTLQYRLPSDSILGKTLLSTIDMVVTMVTPGAYFDVVERDPADYEGIVKPQAVNYLCAGSGVGFGLPERRGTCVTGSYDGSDGSHNSSVVVGDPPTSCLGRCGPGCDTANFSANARVYTQECLNHDLCISKYGPGFANNPMFGKDRQCADEFFAAVESYLSGLDCPHYLVGKWGVDIRYKGEFKNVHFTPEWILYPNGSMTENWTPGSWSLKEKRLSADFTANIGGFAIFTDNRIPAYDLELKGSVTNAFYGNGNWSAVHKTVFTGEPLVCQ